MFQCLDEAEEMGKRRREMEREEKTGGNDREGKMELEQKRDGGSRFLIQSVLILTLK